MIPLIETIAALETLVLRQDLAALMDLKRIAYKRLLIYHEKQTTNLNRPNRAIPDEAANELIIPETSIDLKEYITLNWLTANKTESDIFIVSGAQNQTGVCQNSYGGNKGITVVTLFSQTTNRWKR